jgi:hypothetical protein
MSRSSSCVTRNASRVNPMQEITRLKHSISLLETFIIANHQNLPFKRPLDPPRSGPPSLLKKEPQDFDCVDRLSGTRRLLRWHHLCRHSHHNGSFSSSIPFLLLTQSRTIHALQTTQWTDILPNKASSQTRSQLQLMNTILLVV